MGIVGVASASAAVAGGADVAARSDACARAGVAKGGIGFLLDV